MGLCGEGQSMSCFSSLGSPGQGIPQQTPDPRGKPVQVSPALRIWEVYREPPALSLQRSFPQFLSENARGQGRGAEGLGLVLERTGLR